MSTNTNPHQLEAELLEKLANELFSAGPGTGLAEQSAPVQQPIYGQSSITTQQPGYGSGTDTVPASEAGSGISPSAINQHNGVDLKNPQTSLADPNIPAPGIPASVAGSGVSSSALPGQAVSTGFSNIPVFNTGPGEPSGTGQANNDNTDLWGSLEIPLQVNYKDVQPVLPFQEELDILLNNMPAYLPTAQLPFQPSLSTSPQYYFTKGFTGDASPLNEGGFRGTDASPRPPFDLNLIRNDFPILSETVNGQRLIWLDNAATTQKPRQVIDRLSRYYLHENSNIHRAAHTLAARATDAYEQAREIVRSFINARSNQEIIFVRGTTEGINLVAQSWGDQYLTEGDEIIVSYLEHHANIVPWQILAQRKKLQLKVIPVDDNGELLLEEYKKLLTSKTKLVSITAVSNALGTVNPIQKIIELGHQAGAKVLIDGAQSISHIPTDVQSLDADWLVFSGHKIYGPTGIGVVYGKEDLLNATQPWQGGGNMIKDVRFEKTEYHSAPTRFEAGTGNIADAVGLGAALQYVSQLGIQKIQQYETGLIHYAIRQLKDIPGIRFIGNAAEKAGALSFVLEGFETATVGGLLSKRGIAVRSGHHCAQPILRRFGVESTVRPSFAFYNTCQEIDTLAEAVYQIKTGQLK